MRKLDSEILGTDLHRKTESGSEAWVEEQLVRGLVVAMAKINRIQENGESNVGWVNLWENGAFGEVPEAKHAGILTQLKSSLERICNEAYRQYAAQYANSPEKNFVLRMIAKKGMMLELFAGRREGKEYLFGIKLVEPGGHTTRVNPKQRERQAARRRG